MGIPVVGDKKAPPQPSGPPKPPSKKPSGARKPNSPGSPTGVKAAYTGVPRADTTLGQVRGGRHRTTGSIRLIPGTLEVGDFKFPAYQGAKPAGDDYVRVDQSVPGRSFSWPLWIRAGIRDQVVQALAADTGGAAAFLHD